ncbi:dysbindin-A-like [Seriola lalandi dorsalis]|uniref:dysbindin-A-like n=1 Tax=Seriola lalandi dorsalis TaxID=1841481 RepID=UPI000C6FB5DC|nr:dysbindin-A-like [Seriola lalandi dorsalis]XP_056237672.1 dysbindin-A-like [Seriola aureovittata]
MFENFRERLHMVQQDFTTGLKTLGDKSRDTKIKRRPRFEESLPHFSAGLEILSRYEENWFLLHKRTKDCAQAAEAVDGDIVMLSAHWERRRTALTQLQEQLRSLPAFISELDAITANIAHLEGDFEEMESRLVYLETLCCQCEQQTVKQHHINQLEAYKKKKRRELEALEVELNSEHAQKVAEQEQAQQQKLRERQKVYEEAFHQDVEQYLSTGYLQHREQTGADVSVLDQMTVTNISDEEALDDFLNSTGDDISHGSSLTSGPDLESCSSESSRSQTNQAPPTNDQPSNQGAVWGREEEGGSEESDEPLVQSDEEDIQPDMSLVGLQDVCAAKGSDDSDSVGDLPSG